MTASIIIFLILIRGSFVFPRSKFFYFLDFSWMWIQLAYCTDYYRVDYVNYLNHYNQIMRYGIEIKNSEFGFQLINQIFSFFKVDFHTENAVVMLFVLVVISNIIPMYSKNYTKIASLFMTFPLLLHGIQIRNFISSTIVLYAMKYLISENRFSWIKYFFLCVLAVTIHSTSLVYILLFIPRMVKSKKLYVFTIVLSIAMYSLIHVFSNFFNFMFGEKRFSAKIYIDNTLFEFFLAAAWQLSLLFIIYIVKTRIKKESPEYAESGFDTLIYNITIFMTIIIPLYFSDFSVERLVRNLFVLQYCYIDNSLELIHSIWKSIIQTLFFGWFSLTTIFFELIYDQRWETVVKVYFQNNDVINKPFDHIFLLSLILFSSSLLLFVDSKNIKSVHFVFFKRGYLSRNSSSVFYSGM